MHSSRRTLQAMALAGALASIESVRTLEPKRSAPLPVKRKLTKKEKKSLKKARQRAHFASSEEGTSTVPIQGQL